jgi:uncharacterized protein (TIGR02217 family)
MTFINTPLLETVSYGFSGGPTFPGLTEVKLSSGIWVRNSDQDRQIYRYAAPYDSIKIQDQQALIDAYVVAQVNAASFRFKDWSDYQLVNGVIGVADSDGESTYQMIKDYTFGPLTVSRPITKPRDGTWSITVDNVVTPATVDDLTGLVTVTALTGQTIRATTQFDVPVFFIDKDLTFSFEDWDSHSTQIGLMEDISA